ncbi:hypothetical protein NE865_11288 [Phthorimaea operculella]|nr:hypothetical protein NE865_11288 [Phthorimaea operculella]
MSKDVPMRSTDYKGMRPPKVRVLSTVERPSPREIHIDMKGSRRHTAGPQELRFDRVPKLSTISEDYAYVNPGFVGSTNNVNQTRVQVQPPIDTVYREQYCVCSRWPITMKALAIAVGVLFGAAVGLTITMTLRNNGEGGFEFPLLRSRPD